MRPSSSSLPRRSLSTRYHIHQPTIERTARRRSKVSAYLLPALLTMLILLGAQDALLGDTQADALDDDAIQPGAKLTRGTLGFLFYSQNETNEHGQPLYYASTHGHGSLEGQTGSPALLADGRIPFGVIVAQEKDNYRDWSLIQVDEAYRDHVSAQVRAWTGPSGPPKGDHRSGDTVCLVGYGSELAENLTPNSRCGELQDTFSYRDVTGFRYTATTWRGDSGSPILHHDTGAALGIHLGRHTDGYARAIDLCSLLARFAEHGYHLELATADYRPSRAHVPVPAQPGGAVDSECLSGKGTDEGDAPMLSIMQGGGFEPPDPFGTGS